MNKIVTLACTAFAFASTACYAGNLASGSYHDNSIAAANVNAQGIVTIKDPEAKDTIVFDTAEATAKTTQHGATVYSVQSAANQMLYTLQYKTSSARPEAHSFTVTPEGLRSSRFVTLAEG